MSSGGLVSTKLGRGLCIGLGWCSVGLGFAGIFIPGLPTTIFIIIAAYLFARSSPRFHQWLYQHKWFGPSLCRYRDSGGMPRSAKRAALTSMWIAVSVSSLLLTRVHIAAVLGTLGLGLLGTLAILYGVKTVPE